MYGESVEFEPDAIKEYIDKCISHWRSERWQSDNIDHIRRCEHYIDAYQSIRVALFDHAAPEWR